MDHGHHDMPMGPKCSMNMLWNTQIVDTCVVFRSWHISSTLTLLVSCLIIVGLGIFYEYLREVQKRYDQRVALELAANETKGKGLVSRNGSGRSTPEMEDAGLLSGRRGGKGVVSRTPVPLPFRVIRASLYATTVALSFFLMLVFMTYNAYLIAAVVLGAGIGHYIFGSTMNVDAILSDTAGPRSLACH